MQETAVIGIGQIKIGEHWDSSLRELAGQAIFAALEDAGTQTVDGLFVGNMLSGTLVRQESIGSLIADWVGLKNQEAYKVEAACGSGAAALHTAIMAVASGELKTALAVGVEKMTETKGPETTSALATAADADYEAFQGVSFVALNALIMQRYMHQYDWQHADFAPFSINAHANAVNNPFARLREPISEQAYQNARMIATPINLLDASPIGDGAAAVVITSGTNVSPSAERPIIAITASASATDTLAVHDRSNPLFLQAAYKSALRAYGQAGVERQDIDFFELHDAFSIMSALSLEACGFAERGQAPRLALDGQLQLNGSIPITTLGGLKARGHPVGATGIYQIVEVVQQLRGTAGPNQISGARIGMAQNIGGSGATVLTHILQRKV
jgi:acetyl-CoA C-acetyltransferase